MHPLTNEWVEKAEAKAALSAAERVCSFVRIKLGL
jgi:hypothetical protein